jgi:hypothetical protein
LRMFEHFPGGNQFYIHLSFVIVLNIFLLFIPLTNVFGYEFAAVNALFLFFQGGIFTIANFKKLTENNSQKKILLNLLVGLSLLAIIPVIISCTNSVFTDGCSYIDGFLFYAFITLPSILAGSATGLLIFTVLKKYRRPAFLAIYFILFLIPLLEFYINPQVYFFSPLVGYFPGIIYDEGLSINAQIITYRFFNTLFFSGIFFLSLWGISKSTRYKIILVSSAVAVSILFYLVSPSLGFSTTKGRLASELNIKIETEHFVIHFSERIDENFISIISLQHEFYYSELVEYFKTNPEKISSYVFYDRREKKKLLGSENADLAKPWLGQVFTSYENYNSSLKHELAHVFAAQFGKGLLHIADNYNPSLIEGIAMAADPVYGENNLDYMAALAFNNGYSTDLNKLYDHFNFFKQYSSLSYIYAGSFTKYLIDNYGIEKFKILYGDLDFEKVYKKSFKEITDGYFRHLRTIDKSYNVHAANYYFGRKSIFFKVCPRYVTDQIKIGWQKFNDKNFSEARDIFKNSYDLSDDYSALHGYINSLSKLKEKADAIAFLENEIDKFLGTSSYYNLEFRLADLYAEEGNIAKADSMYLQIIKQNPGRNFYYMANTRMTLARDNSSLRLYLTGSEFTKYYILKRQYIKKNDYNLLPVMIDLSKALDEDYRLFRSHINNQYTDETYESSYAFYKLSNYMLENLDFTNARKMAALATRFKEDKNFLYLLEKNQYKILWLQNNHESLLARIEDQM